MRKMSIIYLDQFVYIKLLQTAEYPEYEKICKRIIESSQKGNNKFPFSFVHIFESLKRQKLNSRKDLLKFIFDLSKFYTIRPFNQVKNMEVRNAILKSLDFKSMDLSDYVFGDEFIHCIGRKVEIKSDKPNKEIPDEIKKGLSSTLKDSEYMASWLCNQTIFGEQFIHQNNLIDLTDKLEKLRKRNYRHPDKNMRKKISIVRFFIEFIRDDFIKVCLEYNLNSKEHIKYIFPHKDSVEVFIKSIPTAYVFHVLFDVLDQDISRPIKPNDILDIMFIAIAVPYCDVVVTERGWSKILNQKKIGEMYETKIIHRIEDLSEFI